MHVFLMLLLTFLIPWCVWGKSGAGHGADQMRASGFKGAVHQVMAHTNVAIDVRPGDVKGPLAEVGVYGSVAQEASVAGVLLGEGLVVPRSRHFLVKGGSSHRISTHESFFVGFTPRYFEALQRANPLVADAVLERRLSHAFRMMKLILVSQYESFYKVPSALAERLAQKDVLLHFLGDYTTQQTVGLPELTAIHAELLSVMQGVWTPEQLQVFDQEITALMASGASVACVAARALALTHQYGATVHALIVKVNGGRIIKPLPQGKLKGLVRLARWRLEMEVRQRAVTYLEVEALLTSATLSALEIIGPRPKAGKRGGKFFCSTLDEVGLLERYFKDGLSPEDLNMVATSMRQRGCSDAQVRYFISHPDVAGGISGREAIRRRAQALHEGQPLPAYVKRWAIRWCQTENS